MGVLFSLGDGERPGLLLGFVCCRADSREAHLGSEDPASTCFTVSAWSGKQALGIFLTLNLLFPVSLVLSLEYIEGKQNN